MEHEVVCSNCQETFPARRAYFGNTVECPHCEGDVYLDPDDLPDEVSEEDFFYARETGGTVVSSALELMHEIVSERYPVSEWNIYGSQASDGDNWPEDSQRCTALLAKILPTVQYYSYVEISEQSPKPLWKTYEPMRDANPGLFAMQTITSPADIFPVFRELFAKEKA